MAPVPVELPRESASERIVISGISGAFPRARSVAEFSDNLYNKVNPADEETSRWTFNHPEVPQHVGLVPDLDKFDAQFFRVHYYLGVNMDPSSRKLLEHAYQAIYDAGVNPNQLSGKKVGVYIGNCLSETEKAVFYNGFSGRTGLGIAGCNKSMYANRVSYWLNAKGPSHAIDAACCSSTVALEQAYQAISRGECEAAIVGGSNLCLHPQTSIQFCRNVTLCRDGKTKSYDQAADGCVKSEAIGVLFLQKSSDALRIYADVVSAKTEFINSDSIGNFNREPNRVIRFLEKFYDDVHVSPQEVEFVEGFGAANSECDKSELDAIDTVFCPGRSEPLNVGSVMSNVGYCEAASGVTAVIKVLLGYHTGRLAGNMHCSQPREDVEGLREGRLRILQDHESISRSYVAINGLSLTGVNSHVLLNGHYKPKDLTKYRSAIPRLVLMSGRTASAVENMIKNLKGRPIDAEELALLHNIHSTKVNGHLGRGFAILDTDEESKTKALCEKAEYFDGANRPLWFVYSGMGSQWAGMGAALLRIPIFAAAIERCRRVLEPKGIDIFHIITARDPKIYDNILHSFVGIAAVQIGLTDILNQLGLVPDKIIGHSVGELGCAYADGCLTAEEMILAAYSRGLVSVETPFIRGSMAAVGIGFEEVSQMCPPEIEVACHNSPTSSTISGPADAMAKFVAQLTAKGIFAKEVPCSNIAYHSRYIAEAGPALLKYLKEVVKTPKLRSERWVSTSIPQERWNEDIAKYSSAEYHTNNLLSPVLFDETSRLIESDAVLVEVAPHGLLQAILKRAFTNCVHVPLTRRAHPDNALFMLEAIGQLFMEGYYPDIRALYPKVEFPVSTGTPHLSHLVEWAHEQTWKLALYNSPKRLSTATCTFKITVYDDEYSYLRGHQIEGKTLLPFASALVSAWDTLAMSTGVQRRAVPVQFRDLQLYSQPMLHNSRPMRLTVTIHRGTGRFEVDNDLTKVASGYVLNVENNHNDSLPEIADTQDFEGIQLKAADIYQMFNERGYIYEDEFRSIREADASFMEGVVLWSGNWATFLDSLLQFNTIRQRHDGISQPSFIREINIDPNYKNLHVQQTQSDLKVTVSTIYDYTRCAGVSLKGIKFQHIAKSEEHPLIFDTSKFDSKYQVEKLINGQNTNTKNVKVLKSNRFGDLESLHWAEAPASQDSGVSVKVHFAGLNTSDVLKVYKLHAKQQYGESIYGMDFSGTTENGTRVMGLMRGGTASERVSARPEMLWPVPSHWSLEDAATVPLPYAQALYCLAIKTVLSPGSTILVDGGAGATGQAMISLALHLDCRVFAVVGDITKKQFLMKRFPKLNAEDIICCRDDYFVNQVLPATNAKGCKVVICSRSEYLGAYMQCCASFGFMMDIHQKRANETYSFNMNGLERERSFIRVDFSGLFFENDVQTLKKLQILMAEGISGGWVCPLPRVSYPSLDATRAFRLLANSRQRGRVLLRMPDAPMSIGNFSLWCSADRWQLVVGDDEALTLKLAAHLVKRGARALYLNIAHTSSRLSIALRSWRKSGVHVETSSEHLAQNEWASKLLKKSLHLGPIEGVFVVNTNQKPEIFESLLASLDAETRKTCPSIRYFAVIGINNTTGKQVCISRAAAHLPAMMLSISLGTKAEDDTAGTLAASYGDIVNALERALQTNQSVIFAAYPPARKGSFSRQIEKIAGITIDEKTDNNQTLQDLGLTVHKKQELWVFLRDKLNITIPEYEVALLTVGRIREMEATMKDSDYTHVGGLEAFFPFVESDELLAAIEVVMMPTLTTSSDMRDDEYDASEPCLFIIPGLQGLNHRYGELCERLQIAAAVLQPGVDHSCESLQDMTARYIKMYLTKKAETNTFYLLGHEMGVLSVLEIAAALEDRGMRGTVYCLGGGPDEFLHELEACVRAVCGAEDSEEALQQAVAQHMCALMGVRSSRLDAALRDAPTWPEKVDASVRVLRGRVPHSTQYARLLIETAYARMVRARRYARSPPVPRVLESRIVLLRSPTTAPSVHPHPLQRYSRQPLAVHDLRASMAYAADDLRAAAAINLYLDEQIAQSFAKKSICHSYLINPDGFLDLTGYSQEG